MVIRMTPLLTVMGLLMLRSIWIAVIHVIVWWSLIDKMRGVLRLVDTLRPRPSSIVCWVIRRIWGVWVVVYRSARRRRKVIRFREKARIIRIDG